MCREFLGLQRTRPSFSGGVAGLQGATFGSELLLPHARHAAESQCSADLR